MRSAPYKIWLVLCLTVTSFSLFAQEQHNNSTPAHSAEGAPEAAHGAAGGHAERTYNDMVMEHISNSNEFHIVGDIHMPLPCILYSKDAGLTTCLSSAFEHGHKVIDGYVLQHGVVNRIADPSARASVSHVDGYGLEKVTAADGSVSEVAVAYAGGVAHKLERSSTLLAFTSWFDFSITKNVFTMFLAVIILFLIFFAVARRYKQNDGKAPSGIQSLFEPLIVFLRDEVVKPSIGPRWERYFPFICTIFFFILVLNLLGLVPFFPGSANVTGSVATSAALAIITFIVVNVSGNKHYWGHIFWMPGLPTPLKPFLAIIEFAGVFIKPFTLLIRLFANITAGHLIILSLLGLIWTLGENGASTGGTIGGAAIALPFAFAMNFLELFVAFLQAFIFALLASLYIGGAVEEHHHEEAHH